MEVVDQWSNNKIHVHPSPTLMDSVMLILNKATNSEFHFPSSNGYNGYQYHLLLWAYGNQHWAIPDCAPVNHSITAGSLQSSLRRSWIGWHLGALAIEEEVCWAIHIKKNVHWTNTTPVQKCVMQQHKSIVGYNGTTGMCCSLVEHQIVGHQSNEKMTPIANLNYSPLTTLDLVTILQSLVYTRESQRLLIGFQRYYQNPIDINSTAYPRQRLQPKDLCQH